MDGRNGKLIREGKSATQAAAVGARGEEGGVGAEMGLLKRKRTSPPESPAPSKKRTAEEAELPKSFIVEPVLGTAGKSQAEQSRAMSGDARVSKELLGQGNEFQRSALAPELAAGSSFEKDVGDLQNGVSSSVENLSHGQGTLFQGRLLAETSGPAVALATDCESLAPTTRHLIPCHAGWFQWAKIHQLERLALPEFFNGKISKKTPEMYMEHRNCIVSKYRENPKLIKFEDVEGLLTGDVSGAVRVFGFLDHWGLINYQAIKDFAPFSSSKGLLDGADEAIYGALQFSPLAKPAFATLFHFEAAVAPGQKFLSTCPGPASNLPLSSSAEATVHESLAAPAVEYHCNSCQADCSKRRYHCQKQADFDLCPECYSDGKFGQGMTGTDFLRMDALTEAVDASGGGWSDQETLLLLEALELYGDNWTEIAEHVATKSKAQCILHFIRLPIEDPFLEDMEAAGSVTMVQPLDRVVSETNYTFYPIDANTRTAENDSQGKTPQNGIPLSNNSKEAFPLSSEQEVSVLTRTGRKDIPHETPTSPKAEGKDELDVSKHIMKVEESNIAQTLLSVSEFAGCTGPDGLIAFADAGNPVMTQVAFLAAMVGPRVAAAAAQAALKSLAEDDPVGFFSARNSFALDLSDDKDMTLVSDYPERSMGQQSTENHLVTCTDGPTESSDDKAASATRKDTNKMVAGSVDKTAGEEGHKCQNSRQNISTKSRVLEESAPSIVKVRTAAVSALASAAVKAKLLADQEEREIQQLVACVIENQLKKLELKLKHFSDLESMLGRECDQAEKARTKVYTERARIVASRLGSSLSAIQMQPTKSTSAPAAKSSSHPATSATQPRPVVFTFGPTGVSAPAAVYKTPSGPESSSPSMPTSTSSQQGATPQRHPRAVPGATLASVSINNV